MLTCFSLQPCCRQYDEPPSGTNSDTTFEATVQNVAAEVAGADVAHKHHHHTASPPYLGHGSEEQVVDNEKGELVALFDLALNFLCG